jgi:general stress protein CsbA
MPFPNSQNLLYLHAAGHPPGFNDVLIYWCLWIDCVVLCFAVFNRLLNRVLVVTNPSLHSSLYVTVRDLVYECSSSLPAFEPSSHLSYNRRSVDPISTRSPPVLALTQKSTTTGHDSACPILVAPRVQQQVLVEVLTYRPFTAVALCRIMIEAQRTRHFPLSFWLTVDVVSILLNVLCTSSRCEVKLAKVKNSPTLTGRNTSNSKRVYDLSILQ